MSTLLILWLLVVRSAVVGRRIEDNVAYRLDFGLRFYWPFSLFLDGLDLIAYELAHSLLHFFVFQVIIILHGQAGLS